MNQTDLQTSFRKAIRTVLPDSAFNNEMEGNLTFLKTYFSHPNRGFMPMLILKTNRGHKTVMMLGELPDTSEKRQAMLRNVMHTIAQDKKMLEEHGIVFAIYLMTEAWMRGQTHKGEEIKLPLADNPIKTEVILAAGMTIDSRTNFAMYPMLRGKDDIIMLDEKNATISPYVDDDKDQPLSLFILQEAFAGYQEGMKGV